MRASLAIAACVVFIASQALADVESGPTVGEPVPNLPAFGVVGSVEGKDVDFASERKESPTVYLFVNTAQWSRPMARFMKELDGKVTSAKSDAVVVAVWLTDDMAKTKQYLPIAQTSLKLTRTALAAFDGRTGPLEWGVNPNADLTVVVADKGKVLAKFGFVSVNDTLVPRVIEALK